MVSVLLPAGVLAATSVDRPATTTVAAGGRVGATGFGPSGIPEEERPAAEATVAPSTVPVPSSVARPAPTTPVGTRNTATTRPSAPSTPTVSPGPTTPTGAPPVAPPPQPVVPVPVTSASWGSSNDDVNVTLRMEPAAPVAGQTVTFTVGFSSAEPCCTLDFKFGDGSTYTGPESVGCDISPGRHTLVTTHVYAGPGAYEVRIFATAYSSCRDSLIGPYQPRPVPHGIGLGAFILVEPRPAGP